MCGGGHGLGDICSIMRRKADREAHTLNKEKPVYACIVFIQDADAEILCLLLF